MNRPDDGGPLTMPTEIEAASALDLMKPVQPKADPREHGITDAERIRRWQALAVYGQQLANYYKAADRAPSTAAGVPSVEEIARALFEADHPDVKWSDWLDYVEQHPADTFKAGIERYRSSARAVLALLRPPATPATQPGDDKSCRAGAPGDENPQAVTNSSGDPAPWDKVVKATGHPKPQPGEPVQELHRLGDPQDLIARLRVEAASWRREDAHEGRDEESQAAFADEAADILEAAHRTIGLLWPAEAEFQRGQPVEKYTGEARWEGVVRSAYLTGKGSLRYVVDVEPRGFQMIAVPSQLRARLTSGRT